MKSGTIQVPGYNGFAADGMSLFCEKCKSFEKVWFTHTVTPDPFRSSQGMAAMRYEQMEQCRF